MDDTTVEAQKARDAELIAKAKVDAARARTFLDDGDPLSAIATVLVGAAELAIVGIEEELDL